MMTGAASLLDLLSPLDWAAAAALLLAMLGTTWIVEHPPANRPSTHILMGRYRLDWMAQMSAREVRIFDAQVLATLRQGVSFFASATLIAIGGGAALLGQVERVQSVVSDLSPASAEAQPLWEAKILFTLLILTLAFLKFVWAIRLFGYCAVLISAVPNDGSTPRARSLAARAGEVNILADRSFTRGLRGVYFSLASLAWFLGPLPLFAATAGTLAIIWRREFASRTRALLVEDLRDHPPG